MTNFLLILFFCLFFDNADTSKLTNKQLAYQQKTEYNQTILEKKQRLNTIAQLDSIKQFIKDNPQWIREKLKDVQSNSK